MRVDQRSWCWRTSKVDIAPRSRFLVRHLESSSHTALSNCAHNVAIPQKAYFNSSISVFPFSLCWRLCIASNPSTSHNASTFWAMLCGGLPKSVAVLLPCPPLFLLKYNQWYICLLNILNSVCPAFCPLFAFRLLHRWRMPVGFFEHCCASVG